jgi:hypothetical protein
VNRDGALGIIGLVLAGAYYAMAADVPESLLSDAVGPADLPKIYAYVLAGLSLILVGRALLAVGRALSGSAGGPDKVRPTGEEPMPVARAAGLLALGVVYLAIVDYAGYVLAIALLIAATIWYQGRELRPRILLVAAGGALLFWLMFVRLLGVQHPPGIWASLL